MKCTPILLLILLSPLSVAGGHKEPTHTTSTPNSVSSAVANSSSSAQSSSQSIATQTANGGNATGGTSTSSTGDSTSSLFYTSRRDTPPAYAPSLYPTATCALGASGGLSLAGVAVSGGGTKLNEECVYLETARSFSQDGYFEQAQAVRCSTPVSLKVFGSREACMAGKRTVDPLPSSVSVNVEAAKPAETPKCPDVTAALKQCVAK